MAHMQRISFLSKRLSSTFRHACLNCTYGRQVLHKQVIMTFSAVGSSKFYLLNNSAVKNFGLSAKQFCVVAKNEISENEETQNAEDVLSCKSLSEINLSDPDVMSTFKDLMQVYTSNRYNRSSAFASEFQSFVSSNEFKNYCNSLEKKLPALSAQELKSLLNCDYFQIPSSSALLQKIYHLVIEKINEYSPFEILAIYRTINFAAHNQDPKCKVLQLVCEQYFKSKLFNDIHASKDYNRITIFCKSGKIPISVRKRLMTFFGKNFEKIKNELTISSLCHIFGALASQSLTRYFKPEMYDLLKSIIAEKPTYLEARDILCGLRQLMINELSYDESFLNTLAEQILENPPGPGLTSELAFRFLELEYLPLPLVKHLERLIADPNFELVSYKLGMTIAKILSDVYYHPLGYCGDDSNHIESIKKLESLDLKMMQVELYVKWCLYLTILGSQRKIERLNDLFNYLANIYKDTTPEVKLTATVVEAIIALHAFARKNFPDDVAELPEHFLRKCYDILKTDSTKVIKTDTVNPIHQALGDSLDMSTALEYCSTSMYHCIDFAVLLNEANEPQQITVDSEHDSSNSIFRIENIKKPPSSKLILYQLYRGNTPIEFKNRPVLPGTVQLYLQSFEPVDCRVVLFSVKELRSLNQNLRTNYLATRINETLQQPMN